MEEEKVVGEMVEGGMVGVETEEEGTAAADWEGAEEKEMEEVFLDWLAQAMFQDQ